jgi:hypothetical protein
MSQVFRKKPTEEQFRIFLNCFNVKDILKNPVYFQISHLSHYNTLFKLDEIKDEFRDCYYPNKFMMYFTDITLEKSIVMLRQILRIFNYDLIRSSQVDHGKKTFTYMSLNKSNLHCF